MALSGAEPEALGDGAAATGALLRTVLLGVLQRAEDRTCHPLPALSPRHPSPLGCCPLSCCITEGSCQGLELGTGSSQQGLPWVPGQTLDTQEALCACRSSSFRWLSGSFTGSVPPPSSFEVLQGKRHTPAILSAPDLVHLMGGWKGTQALCLCMAEHAAGC